MQRKNSLVLFWPALLLVAMAVPGREGAVVPMASSASPLDPPMQVALTQTTASSSESQSGAGMLQFRAGGHVLGFQPRKVFLAGLDHALRVEFLGTAGVMPTSPQDSADKGKTGKAPPLSTVVYRNLWEGIDLTYESTEGSIAESTYHVAPGADPSKIQLRYNIPVELQGDGSLKLKFERGALSESPPVAWQEVEGNRVPVKAEFRVAGNEVEFVVGPYDRTQPLIIDPTYKWHTFYFREGYTYSYKIALDSRGNIYIMGETHYYGRSGPDIDLTLTPFVAKFDSSGAFQWAQTGYTYSSIYCTGERDRDFAVDGNGSIYIVGTFYTNDTLPWRTTPASSNIAVKKLDSNGNYQWITSHGSPSPSQWGGGYDYGRGIAVDGNGYIYITGDSDSTWGSPLHAHGGEADIVVLKLDNNGTYLWHTFYGTGNSHAADVALDGNGNIYVTGDSDSTWGSPLHAHNGKADIVVLKLDNNGTYLWHTFYGADAEDFGGEIVVDGAGNVYTTGASYAAWGSPLCAYSGGNPDTVILKLDTNGAYQWHTFCRAGSRMAVDGSGNIYVNTHPGFGVMKLDGNGAHQWETSYGTGSSAGIALDANGNVYATGSSSETWGVPLNAFTGRRQNAVVLKMAPSAFDSPDTNGDGKSDILWRHAPTGSIYAWLMNGMSASSQGTLGTVLDSNWHIERMGDFNGDGRSDILWRHADGSLYSWLMNGVTAIGAGSLGTVDPSWSVAGVGDLGGDGKADILWRHTGGAMFLWEMDGLSVLRSSYVDSVDPSWEVKTLADFNGDGKADILWQHTSGALYLWEMDGAMAIGLGSPGTAGWWWDIVGAADFTGDGKADILWHHSSGKTVIWEMDGARPMNMEVLGTVHSSWSIADAHDFNGDGKADILWRHTSGATYLWLMNGFTVVGEGSLGLVDPSWSIENR